MNTVCVTIENNEEDGIHSDSGGLDGVSSARQEPSGKSDRAETGFEVKDSTGPYRPLEASPSFNIDHSYPSAGEEIRTDHRLLVGSQAMDTISNHIGWGRQTEANQVEQGGVLVGSVLRESESNLTTGVASTAIPATEAEGSISRLHFNHEVWSSILRRVDELDRQGSRNSQIIGWYHTHPGRLSVFMSTTDQATQRQIFTQDWHFAVVMNPQKEVWRVFHGPESEECKGFVIR